MIDPSKLGIPSEEQSDFKELCNDIYRFISSEEHSNLFNIMNAFPLDLYPRFEIAFNALQSDSSIVNGSKGFLIGRPPEFVEQEEFDQSDDEIYPYDDTGISSNDASSLPDSGHLERIDRIKEIDSRAFKLLSDDNYYIPSRIVEESIESMKKGTQKAILHSFFIEEDDIDDLVRVYRADAEKAISKFSQKFPMDAQDMDLFEKYNLSSNVFVYLFNRSMAYLRLFSVNFDPGFGDATELVFPESEADAIHIHRDPNSDVMISLPERMRNYISGYLHKYGESPESFVDALLALFNNVPLERERVAYLYRRHYGAEPLSPVSDSEWRRIFDHYIEFDGYVKHLSFDNIHAVRSILSEVNELNYGISIDRLYKGYSQRLAAYYIDSPQELRSFILKYTPYRIQMDRVLIRGTLEDAIQNFVSDVEVYDFNRLIKIYTRRCGGPGKHIEPILKSIDMSLFLNEAPLTKDEEKALSAKLSEFEWLSKDNARSIFADLHDLEDKFTEMNMHRLGFTSLADVYYRCKYSTFSECLLQNEFVGDEKYIDDLHTFYEIKMKMRAYYMEVESLERYLRWIPVSKYRFINLGSPRYKGFADVLVAYRSKIINLCKDQFVTPFSLKNTVIGIPEIDDDDYGLEFYDAMLLASKANHQTYSRQRFYFIPTDSTSFGCSAPEFTRYMVYNNGGSASIAEIQAILDSEYGIRADMSVIRNMVKLSTCIYSLQTDSAYLDDEIYMEAIKNEPK